MPEDNTEETVSVRVPKRILDEIKDEQHRRRKAKLPEPTQAELIGERWDAYRPPSSRDHVTPGAGPTQKILSSHTDHSGLIEFPLPETAESKALKKTFAVPGNRRLLEMLATILNSGVTDAIGAVAQNLEVFSKYVEGQEPDAPPAPPKRRKK